jgi:hypothetical protein
LATIAATSAAAVSRSGSSDCSRSTSCTGDCCAAHAGQRAQSSSRIGAELVFADDAIARLHKVSLGIPRALNNAAIAALIAAASAGKALVDDDCAKKAVAELTRE